MTIPPHFATIDVNTADQDPSSICQVGIALYFGCQVAEQFTTRIDPEGVEGAHTFEDIAPHIFKFLHGEIVVSYGPLASQSIEAAYQEVEMDCPESQWIDCQQVIRRTWPKFSGGDELEKVCEMIRYSYIPGDALQDAQAAGIVFLAAIKESGYTAEAWVKMAKGLG